jgi:hypothetical protein
MKLVADFVHSLGLKFGLWLDASNNWNAEEIPGSYGYDHEDANTFASWGVDYVKADWGGNAYPPSNDPENEPDGSTTSAMFDCQQYFINRFGLGGSPDSDAPSTCDNGAVVSGTNTALSSLSAMHEGIAQAMYGALSKALEATGRNIYLNLCVHDNLAQVQTWAGPKNLGIGQDWKSDLNISDSLTSMTSMVNDVYPYYEYAGPGGFNDPDMLEVGNNANGSGGGSGGMTPAQDQSEFSLWAEMAAPLIMSLNMAPANDVTAAEARTGIYSQEPPATSAQDAYDMTILGNKEVIAVDQDPLGLQGVPVVTPTPSAPYLVLAKPLADGNVAVTLFNEGYSPGTVSTTVGAVDSAIQQAYGITEARSGVYGLQNLWSQAGDTETAGTISSYVEPGATTMYLAKVPTSYSAALADPSNTTLSLSPNAEVAPGGSATVTATLANNGDMPVLVQSLSLSAPEGWTVTPATSGAVNLGSGGADAVAFTVTAPATLAQPVATGMLTAAASYETYNVPPAQSSTATTSFTVVAQQQVSSPYMTADTTYGRPALFTEPNTGQFVIRAAGTGITAASSRSPASNQYGVIYLHNGADTSAVAQAEVTSVVPGGDAGLMMRNDATATNDPNESAVLYYTYSSGKDTVYLGWNNGYSGTNLNTGGALTVNGTNIGATASASVTVASASTPLYLELSRNGSNTYTGSYSTNGTTWTQVGTTEAVTQTTQVGADQDVGIWASSATAGNLDEADFGQFTVTG